MKSQKKKNLLQLIVEYAKLQLASNIPFWGTYIGYAIFDQILFFPSFYALAIPTVLSNVLFFIVDDKWVFTSKRGNRKSSYEILKFIIFMSFSGIVVFAITIVLEQYYNITPYIGQFISGFVASLWTFLGLRFWVFAPPRHHGVVSFRKKANTKRRARTA